MGFDATLRPPWRTVCILLLLADVAKAFPFAISADMRWSTTCSDGTNISQGIHAPSGHLNATSGANCTFIMQTTVTDSLAIAVGTSGSISRVLEPQTRSEEDVLRLAELSRALAEAEARSMRAEARIAELQKQFDDQQVYLAPRPL